MATRLVLFIHPPSDLKQSRSLLTTGQAPRCVLLLFHLFLVLLALHTMLFHGHTLGLVHTSAFRSEAEPQPANDGAGSQMRAAAVSPFPRTSCASHDAFSWPHAWSCSYIRLPI